MSSGNLDRRQFVVLGGAAVFSLAAGLPAMGAAPLPGSFTSVGYQPLRSGRSMGRRRGSVAPGASASAGFVDGRTLLTGDPRFFQAGARFRIHDFHRSGDRAPERIDVEVLYAVPELDQPARFFAFSSIESPQRRMTSNPIAFTVPVESTGRVELTIERRGLVPARGVERSSITFDVNDGQGGALKLNEGLYAVALLRSGQGTPDWPSVRTAEPQSLDRNTSTRLVIDRLGGVTPVPFDYLLLTVTRVIPPDAEPETVDAEPTAVSALRPE